MAMDLGTFEEVDETAIENHINDKSNEQDADDVGGEEEESEMVVLDPSHPLMERIQAAISQQLQARNEQLEIKLREAIESLKISESRREEIGVELYGVQQQLARQQMLIEKEQDQHSSYTYQRKQKEHSLAEVQKLYQNMSQQLKQIQEQSKNLRNEMETSALRVKYLSEAHSTVQQDIALTMRATEKTSTDIFKSQDNKLKQDLYIDKLTMQIAQLEEQIGLITAQSQAQAHETKSTKQALSEAAMELEVLFLEKKKLNHQWNNSLIGMKRRDEAYSAMVTARNIQQQEINSMNTQLDNYKKSIIKEQEHNEQLTLLKNKIDADIIRIKQSIDQCEVKMEALKVDYMTYTRALQETEQTLTVVNGECTIKKNELSSLRMQIEREALDKRRLEDSVMENMMQRLTMDKSTQYSLKSLNRFRNTAKELEIVLANVKNEISQTTLEMAEITSVFKNLYQMLDKENAAISNQNDLISKSEGEITRNNAYIKRKQTQIDQLNKKIDSKVSKMGMTEDMGPWEAKIDDLHKQISDSMEKCAKMQQHWLRQQNDLVKKTNEIDELTFSIDNLRKEELILSQKKLKLDSELENDEKSCHTISNAIESLQKEMVHLNTLITTKRGEQDTLEQKNSLLEKDFISALKEAELEFLQLQSRVHQLKEEKERLINSVMESEHQIMLWEKKITLAKEMKDSVDSETGQAEIKAMKAEIHRMQVRHSQLMRQQESMIQNMEKAIYRRDVIIQSNDAQHKTGKNVQTQAHLQKKIIEVQKKIKQTHTDIANCDGNIEKLVDDQTALVNKIQEIQSLNENNKISNDSLQLELQEVQIQKQLAMSSLLAAQSQVKHLTAAKEKKYRFLHKSDEARLKDLHLQKEKLQSLWCVVQKLEAEIDSPLVQRISKQLISHLETIQQDDTCT